MINVVALGLVLSSLVTAGVWSPSEKGGEDVIVKEGHRVVVVEYDPQLDGNTKVLISPHDTHVSHTVKEKFSSLADDVKGKAKENLEDAKGKAQETIEYTKEKAKEATGGPRELMCDAFGKCKQKIASTIGKAKDEGTEKAHEVEEKAKDTVSEAIGKTKDTLSNKIDKVSDKAHEAKDTVKEAVDTAKTIGNDVAKNLTSKLGEARETAGRVKEEGGRELGEIFGHGRDLAKDVVGYVVSPRLVESAMGIVHLLGFATAYGMCVWVTFVSSYVLAGALPMQQFGMVQSKVYPVYFRILAYTVMVTLVGHLYGQRKRLFANTLGMAQAYGLLGSFVMVMYNLLYLEPRATKVMFKKMKIEKEEGRGLGRDSFLSEKIAKLPDHVVSATSATPATSAGTTEPLLQTLEKTQDYVTISQINKLSERLKKLNSYSSFLNILTLVVLTSHLAYLGQRLHVTC